MKYKIDDETRYSFRLFIYLYTGVISNYYVTRNNNIIRHVITNTTGINICCVSSGHDVGSRSTGSLMSIQQCIGIVYLRTVNGYTFLQNLGKCCSKKTNENNLLLGLFYAFWEVLLIQSTLILHIILISLMNETYY